ncbi:MAG: carboxypeptidase regulatory-like domain-containing protein, partial [Pseudomonadota bacterium]
MARFTPSVRRLLEIAAISIGLLGSASAFAQSGALEVRARHAQTNRPLSDVTVTISSRAGDVQTAVTGSDGRATMTLLDPGLYSVAGEADGFLALEEPSVRLIGNRTMLLQLALQPLDDSAIDEVVVTGRARFADPYGASSSSFLNSEELRSAVGAGSDVMRALDGLPGLISTGDFANFTVRGRSPRDNLIFVDGFPLDKVVHFDQSLGEDEDIGGGGRFSIFAPNSIQGAEFSPGGWGAAFGGRAGSLLQLNVAGGGPSPSASMRLDIAGVEVGYDGPSGLHDDTSVFFTARSFDFGRVFEQIDQEDIGQPQLTDVILKTVTEVNANNSVEVLAIFAPEDYTRDIDNVLASPDFEDALLVESEQDLGLLGVTWRRLIGDTGEWAN